MLTLLEIAKKHGTDKAISNSDYIKRYEHHLISLRHKPISLLEIGVGEGKSLRTWEEYFDNDNTTITGFDNDLNCFKLTFSSKVTLMFGDQGSLPSLKEIEGKYDIIIDDGSHKVTHQILTFETLFPRLNSGGIYVVEDLHTSSFLIYPKHKDFGQFTFYEYIYQLVDYVNMRYTDDYGYANHEVCINKAEQNNRKLTWERVIDSLHISKGIIFIYKR